MVAVCEPALRSAAATVTEALPAASVVPATLLLPTETETGASAIGASAAVSVNARVAGEPNETTGAAPAAATTAAAGAALDDEVTTGSDDDAAGPQAASNAAATPIRPTASRRRLLDMRSPHYRTGGFRMPPR